MTDPQPHTPTTEVVKDAACFPRDRLGEPRGIDTDAFDRWLAEHDSTIEAAAEQRGAAKALRDAAESDDLIDHMFTNLLVNQPIAVRETSKYLHNRADQEGE